MNKLAVFDFDGTLFDTLDEKTGKLTWLMKTGNEYPHNGWWSKPESLNHNILPIKPYGSILSLLNKYSSNDEYYVVILTNRLEKLRGEVEEILNKFNVTVDEVILKDGGLTKGDRILDLVNKLKSIESIEVYDDMQNDISKYKEYSDIIPKLESDIDMDVYYANKGRVRLINNSNR